MPHGACVDCCRVCEMRPACPRTCCGWAVFVLVNVKFAVYSDSVYSIHRVPASQARVRTPCARRTDFHVNGAVVGEIGMRKGVCLKAWVNCILVQVYQSHAQWVGNIAGRMSVELCTKPLPARANCWWCLCGRLIQLPSCRLPARRNLHASPSCVEAQTYSKSSFIAPPVNP